MFLQMTDFTQNRIKTPKIVANQGGENKNRNKKFDFQEFIHSIADD